MNALAKKNAVLSALPNVDADAPGSRDLIANQLGTAIEEGRIPAGTPIRQASLASHYRVSRMPVREALRQLESKGLLTNFPHKGMVVADRPSAYTLPPVFDIKQAVLVFKACLNGRPEGEAYDDKLAQSLQAVSAAASAKQQPADGGDVEVVGWLAELQTELYELAGMAEGISTTSAVSISHTKMAPRREYSLGDARAAARLLQDRLIALAEALAQQVTKP